MKQINSNEAPKPVGPYSQAVMAGGFVFCSGQIGLDPFSNTLKQGVKEQTKQALINIEKVLGAAGLSMKDVVRVTVYLKNMNDFQEMNEEYTKHFSNPFPARTTVEVSSLPKGALVEIDAIATKDTLA
jgi:2-iminobutanoate/2-iminopropanoate deaminase